MPFFMVQHNITSAEFYKEHAAPMVAGASGLGPGLGPVNEGLAAEKEGELAAAEGGEALDQLPAGRHEDRLVRLRVEAGLEVDGGAAQEEAGHREEGLGDPGRLRDHEARRHRRALQVLGAGPRLWSVQFCEP